MRCPTRARATLPGVHPHAIRADAQAQLAALRAWPQAPRCYSGAHVGGPLCHQHGGPTTGGDHPPIDTAPPAIHAVPFETWAAT